MYHNCVDSELVALFASLKAKKASSTTGSSIDALVLVFKFLIK